MATVAEMWQELRDGLRTFIRKRVADEEDVEDILQEVFLRMHQGIDSVKDRGRIVSCVRFRISRYSATRDWERGR